jgi:hypothetical protein
VEKLGVGQRADAVAEMRGGALSRSQATHQLFQPPCCAPIATPINAGSRDKDEVVAKLSDRVRAAMALGLMFPAAIASADSSVKICGRAAVTMPSFEQHRAWLASNTRYGPELAEQFFKDGRSAGDNYVEYQIVYHEEEAASAWFDIQGLSGLSQANEKVLKQWVCDRKDYPIVFLIGLEAASIKRGTLYVTPRKGQYVIVSLRKSNKVTPVRLAGSNKLICPDLKDLDSSETGCTHPSIYFR